MMRLYVIYFVTLTHVITIEAQRIAQNEIQEKAKVMNISYNKCTAGKTCVHGLCNEKMGACVCYYGWRGELCDRLTRDRHLFRPRKTSRSRNEPYKTRHRVVTTPRRRRMNPDRYVINLLMAFFPKLRGYFKRILDLGAVNKETTNTFQISPVATSKFAMDVKKETQARKRLTTTELPDVEMNIKVNEIKPTSEELQEEPESIDSGVCSDSYKLRPLSERMCTPGLVCTFGTCSSEHKGTYIAFDCSCDSGASGLMCEHKCCLDCGSNGRCAIFADGKEYCRCRRGYSGENCEHSETDVRLANTQFDSNSFKHVFLSTSRRLAADDLHDRVTGAAVAIMLLVAITIVLWKRFRGSSTWQKNHNLSCIAAALYYPAYDF